MSESITLSDGLIEDLCSVIEKHDTSTEKNMMVALQYLAAASGYMLADFPGSESEREELIDQLGAFTKHVAQEHTAEQPQEAEELHAPAGKCVTTSDPAIGIWKPE